MEAHLSECLCVWMFPERRRWEGFILAHGLQPSRQEQNGRSSGRGLGTWHPEFGSRERRMLLLSSLPCFFNREPQLIELHHPDPRWCFPHQLSLSWKISIETHGEMCSYGEFKATLTIKETTTSPMNIITYTWTYNHEYTTMNILKTETFIVFPHQTLSSHQLKADLSDKPFYR